MQNWNSVIQYVKANLGIKSTNLEFTDTELITYFKEQTLPAFSNHSPRRLWAALEAPTVPVDRNLYYSPWIYQLKNPNNETIIDVVNVYKDGFDYLLTSGIYLNNPVDIVMANTMSTMIDHLQPVNTFEFIQPNLVKFEFDPFMINNSLIICEIYVEHKSLDFIPRDMFQKLFKLMALADTFTLILNTRNKFSNVTTPFGQIDLNIDYIQQRLESINQKIDDIVMYKPPRDYLVFI